MDVTDIEQLVAAGESETLEFKKSTGQLNRAAETLCAFLNRGGGTVLIGVTDKRQIVGQDVSDGTLQEIANALRQFEPPASIRTESVKLPDSGRQVIALTASSSEESRPFTFNGRPYERTQSTTSVMPRERFESLLLERAHSSRRWENTPSSDVSIDDLDSEEILRTVRTGISAGRLPESTSGDATDILERLGLISGGKVLNAAVALFGTRFLPDYPQCQLRMARFKGIDKTEFLDNRQIHGCGFVLLEEAMLFLSRHLPVAGRIEPGLFERVDEPLFPPAALREALVNAICHRDYSSVGGAVSLSIFDDRLEVWSDGGLPFGLKTEDLKRDHPSRPRNPLIAEVFFRRGLVERWGRGTQKIVELCVKAGHPEPEFIEQAGAVGVRFVPSGYIAPHRVAHDLTARQREILQVLSGAKKLALREVRGKLGNPPADRTLREDLRHLLRIGLIDREGRGRGAYWFMRSEDAE